MRAAARLAPGIVVALAAAGCTPAPIDVATLGNSALTTGLLAHWPLDEGSGASVSDSSGNGHNGVLEGPAWTWTTGQFGGAVHFSGADSVAVAGFPHPTQSYSVSAWVLIASSELGAPIGNLVSTEVLGGGWALYATLGTGYLTYAFQYAVNGPQQYAVVSCTDNCVQPGAWTHVTAVLDADAASLTLYVGSVVQMTAPFTTGILPGSSTLEMGRSGGLQPLFPVTGALDDIAIYNRALEPEEVAALGAARAPDPH